MDFYKGYVDYGDYRECSDINLWSDLGFDHGEDLSMEVGEVLNGDPPNISYVESTDSKSNESLALKIPRLHLVGATPEIGKATDAPPLTGVRKSLPPKSAKGDPPQVGGTPTQSTTGGQARVPAGLSRIFTSPLCSFVPVPITVSVPITLSHFVSVPVPISVSIPVSVIVLIPVLPPGVLLLLARVGSLGPLASPFGIGLGATA
ncbi:hypothetical protein P4O66_001179 [Electrophorus voltai]|uniref:Uncharacterized protein n=1 Tax=Electrophorus voltai TaxID=2609070 RepID=A0AAD8ZAH0_9TELE|nr:hypothetical protein P4O66_001179 [Electrophorus voltai]